MLYPLSYEGITGLSSLSRRCCTYQNPLSTPLTESLTAFTSFSPPFKHDAQ